MTSRADVRRRVIAQEKSPHLFDKKCTRCSKIQKLTEFYRLKLKSGYYGYQSVCKLCYPDKQFKYKETLKASSKAWRRRFREEIQTLKESTPCNDCGKQYSYYVMQFDHVVGDKKFNLSAAVGRQRKQDIYDEIEKCEIVCSNCHAERTHQRKQI